MSLQPSACIWSYKPHMTIDDALNQIKQTAFHYVDVDPETLSEPEARQTQKDLGLMVSCMALAHGRPADCSWEGKDEPTWRNSVDSALKALEAGQSLGIRAAYVVPCKQSKQLHRFGNAVAELAEDAAKREIKLCVEHVPNTALPKASDVLTFLEQKGHSNLYLLLDVGHTILSKEKASEIVEAAGDRLGYVQFNDNDGKKDRHWALLDGRLTRDELQRVLDALKKIGYDGTLAIQLNEKQKYSSLVSGFSRNRNLLLRMQEEETPEATREPETRRKH